MHLLAAQPGGIVDGSEAVDLGQTPGDIVVLSAADTELAGLAQAYAALGDGLPSLRLANLLILTHNLSVDAYTDDVIAEACCPATTSPTPSWPGCAACPPRSITGCGSTASRAGPTTRATSWPMPPS